MISQSMRAQRLSSYQGGTRKIFCLSDASGIGYLKLQANLGLAVGLSQSRRAAENCTCSRKDPKS